MLTGRDHANVNNYRSYQIKDAKHGKILVSGLRYDNHVYHQDVNGRDALDNAHWVFIPVVGDEGYYHIKELRHEKAMITGDTLNNNIYHQDPSGRENAKWRVEEVENKPGYFRFFDKKWNKCVVAGDKWDNNTYCQPHGYRLNAEWTLFNPLNNDKPGPAFILLDEKVVDFQFEMGSTIQSSPDIVTKDVFDNLKGSQPIVREATIDEKFSTTSTFSVSQTLSKSAMMALSYSAGIQIEVLSIGSEAKLEVSTTKSTTTGREVTFETTTTYTDKITVTCPPGKRMECTFQLTKEPRDIPFTATLLRRYADNHEKVEKVEGVWHGTQFSDSLFKVVEYDA